jgi:hypothetical protein
MIVQTAQQDALGPSSTFQRNTRSDEANRSVTEGESVRCSSSSRKNNKLENEKCSSLDDRARGRGSNPRKGHARTLRPTLIWAESRRRTAWTDRASSSLRSTPRDLFVPPRKHSTSGSSLN